jgi:dephospho-CoA kinase
MIRLGITGGIGSGKSTIARFFGERGAVIFDADMEAKLILLHSEPVQQSVVAAFGDPVLNEVGEIDFGLLASYAFAEPERQHILNEIIHPEVIMAAEREMIAASERQAPIFILDAPLLFEARIDQYLDYSIAVLANEEVRIRRAAARGILSEEDIRRRAGLQISDEERAMRADFVVDNNGTLDELYRQLQEIYDSLPLP